MRPTKSILVLFTGVVLSFLPAMTYQVKAVENIEVSINEWNYRFDRYSLDFNQSTYRTSWTHKELKDRVPFYDEVLGAWPVSIRLPKQIYVPKNLSTDSCFLVPLQIRAEVDLSFLRYVPSPIEIEFWPRVVMQGQTLSYQGPNLTVGPKDWSESQQVIEKKIPICISKEISSKEITAFFIRTNLLYTRLFSEFDAPKAECWSYTIEGCRYIGPYGGGIEVVQTAYNPVDEGKGFEGTITQLKEYLLSVSSLEKQNFELAKRNLAFAERELPAAQSRSKMLAQELETKAKAEAEARAQAEAKAKAVAESKAQAEAKAKAEEESRLAECQKAVTASATLRSKVISAIGAFPNFSKRFAQILEDPLLLGTCPESLRIAILNSTFELIKLEASTKKATIICIKGKITKKVTAVNPKCPAGYKKK